MKTKELKLLAQKIANLEEQLKTASPQDKRGIEDAIFKLSRSVKSLDDMMALDCMIQDILNK